MYVVTCGPILTLIYLIFFKKKDVSFMFKSLERWLVNMSAISKVS